MSRAFEELIDQADSDDLLSTGEVAQLLGVSRQHVVDLCKRGDIPFLYVGSHRKIRRVDAELARGGQSRTTRDQRRSLWLSFAIAGELVRDPDLVIRAGRAGLDRLGRDRRTSKWVTEWRHLLDGPPDEVLLALTSNSLRSRELRQNSPFAGVLSEGDREQILRSFSTAGRSGHEPR
ncbi:MAG: helix-turn-helix domain-containing protein [Pseudolysinimonas sp.]